MPANAGVGFVQHTATSASPQLSRRSCSEREMHSVCQGELAGLCYIPLSSVAEMVWKDLGQVQRKSNLAGKAPVFFRMRL